MYAIQTVAGFSLDCLGKRQVGSHDHIHFQLDVQWSSNHDDDLCRLPHYFVSVLWGSAVAITWRFAITPVQLRLWLSPAWPCRALRQYPRDYMWLMIRDLWVGVIHKVRRTSAPLPPMDGVPLYLTVLWLIHIIQQLVSEKKYTEKADTVTCSQIMRRLMTAESHGGRLRAEPPRHLTRCITLPHSCSLAAAPAAAICFGGANF